MMPFSPYFGSPYYRRPQNHLHNLNSQNFYNQKKEPIPKDCSNNYSQYNNCTNTNNFNNINNNDNSFVNKHTISNCNTDSHEYEEFINIFGFKLYFDDLLILALLFFLYKEEIKDESLYIALILLLLT